MRLTSHVWWVAVLIAVSVASCGDQRSNDEKLADSIANFEAKEYRTAVIDLKNILRQEPANSAARVALGKTLLRIGDIEAAEKELMRARELGADQDEFVRELVTAMSRRGANAEILAEIDPQIFGDTETADFVRAYRANAMLALGSVAEADVIFTNLLQSSPSAEAKRLSYLGKAEISKRDGDIVAAETYVRQSLNEVAESAASTLALGQILILQSKFAEADEVLTWGRDNLDGLMIDHYMLAAGVVEAKLGLSDIDGARDALKIMARDGQKHPMTDYLTARVHYLEGDMDATIEILQQLLANYRNYRPAQTLIGAASLRRGDLEEAEMFLSSALSADPSNTLARRLLAQARLQMKRPQDATDTLREGLTNDAGNTDLLTMLGRTAVVQGDTDSAIAYLEKSLAAKPDDVEAKLALASAYMSAGQAAKAVELLDSVPADQIDQQRRDVLRVMAQYDSANPLALSADVEKLQAAWPKDETVLLFAGSYNMAVERFDLASDIFEEVLANAPGNRAAILNLIRLDERSGDFTRTNRYLDDFLKQEPDDLLFLLARARAAERAKDNELALSLVRRAHAAHPKELLPNLIMAGHAIAVRDWINAQAYARAAVDANPESDQARRTLALYFMRRGEWQSALPELTEAVSLNGDSALNHSYLGRTQIALGRLAQARKSFAAVVRLDPSNLESARSLALLEIRAGNIQAAEDLLADLRQKFPDRAQIFEIEGDVRSAQDDVAKALDAYARAANIEPSRSLAVKTYRLRRKSGMPNPTAALNAWLDRAPKDVAVRLLLAQDLQRGQRIEQAIAQYEMIVELEPDSALALNNLAWMYFEQGSSEERIRALEVSAKAYELASGSAQIADTYGWILFKSGQVDRAQSVLKEALDSTSAGQSPDVAYHLAALLQEKGERSQAKELLAQALASKANFYSRNDAQQLHDSL